MKKIYFKLQSIPLKWKINFSSELKIEGVFVGKNWWPIQEVKISCGKQKMFCQKKKYKIEIGNEKKTGLYKFAKKLFPQKTFSIIKIKVYTMSGNYQKKIFLIQLKKDKNHIIENNALIYKNLNCYNSKKQNILLCVHEISLSGAPILGLELAKQLSKTYNIVLWTGKIVNKVLVENFQKCCFKIYLGFENHFDIMNDSQQTPIQFSILNSIINARVLPALKNKKIKTILLIHEYAYFVAKNIRTLSFELADAIIMPAASVRDSYEEIQNFPQHKIFIRPQGFIETKNLGEYCAKQLKFLQTFSGKIILSCGTISERKGFDLFLQTAQIYQQLLSGQKTLFVWLGDPALNFKNWYGVYQDYMEGSNVLIIPAQKNIAPFFQQADIFYMCSRLDPCPNVVIYAMYHLLPIILFDKGCGCTQFFSERTGAKIIPYLNTYKAAQCMHSLLTNKKLTDEMGTNNKTYVQRELNFKDYTADILKIAKNLQEGKYD